MSRLTIEELREEEVRGKRLLVRVDFNVPLEGGRVTDATRIRAVLPTLERLRSSGGRLLLASHLGRPKGEADPAYSLRPVARNLSDLMEGPVVFLEGDPAAPDTRSRVDALREGEVALLENVRFHQGETKNDPALAKALAELADHFVSDAFGAAHRAHASTVGAPRFVRERGGRALAGLLMAKELRFLDEALRAPERPFVALLGGAKISGKIDVIEAVLGRVDRLLIGGAMANTFFRALGLEVGRSLVEEDRVAVARRLLEEAGDRILLPVDCAVAPEIERGVEVQVRRRDEVRPDERIGDIGPESVRLFAGELAGAATIVWNGPMGVFELPPFDEGTREVARAVADATEGGALSIVGGGDSAAACEASGVTDRVTHVSTGGGASLELLAGKELPGVEVLEAAKAAGS